MEAAGTGPQIRFKEILLLLAKHVVLRYRSARSTDHEGQGVSSLHGTAMSRSRCSMWYY